MIRKFFLWTRSKLTRLEVYDYDLKKPEIPQQGRFAQLHERILNARSKKKNHGKGH